MICPHELFDHPKRLSYYTSKSTHFDFSGQINSLFSRDLLLQLRATKTLAADVKTTNESLTSV